MSIKKDFMEERETLNEKVFDYAGKEIKRFFSLDGQMYRKGALDESTKEMMGLVASAVLRCDDCIKYHLIRCYDLGVTGEQIQEVLGIAMMVGGSIVIPHTRRAFKVWDELQGSPREAPENPEEIKALPETFEKLLETVKIIVRGSFERDEKLYSICKLLKEKVDHYDWVGFYEVDPKAERELVLGPYVGDPTEHGRIKFGEGICGQAAEQEMSFVVQDVSRETNYLSCSPDVKSEILAPIFKAGKVVGEIDIDSHRVEPFTDADQTFLEQVAEEVATLFSFSS